MRVLLRKIDLLRLQCYSTPLRPHSRRMREEKEIRACRRPRSAPCRALALRFRPH